MQAHEERGEGAKVEHFYTGSTYYPPGINNNTAVPGTFKKKGWRAKVVNIFPVKTSQNLKAKTSRNTYNTRI